MPELAVAFSIGSLVSLIASVLFAFTQLSKYKSKNYQQLQKNLGQIKLRYSDIEGRVQNVEWADPESIQQEIKRAQRKEIDRAKTTYWLFGFASVIFSWLGLIFLIIMWVSITKLVKNRLEIALFESELAHGDLTAEKTTQAWQQIKSLGFDS